jgi:hypothetical protein
MLRHDNKNDDDRKDNYYCKSGIAASLKKYKPYSITKKCMSANFFKNRFDTRPSLSSD